MFRKHNTEDTYEGMVGRRKEGMVIVQENKFECKCERGNRLEVDESKGYFGTLVPRFSIE
jgi:hypothetical protein